MKLSWHSATAALSGRVRWSRPLRLAAFPLPSLELPCLLWASWDTGVLSLGTEIQCPLNSEVFFEVEVPGGLPGSTGRPE